MTKFYMMVGLPASGKSTYAKLLAEEIDGIVVSSDGIREEWYGDEAIQGDPAKIFREVEQRCVKSLKEGRSVVMDATNMNAKKRTNFLRQLPACYKACVVMAVPFIVCVIRDEARSRSVGPLVLEKMRKNFQMPYYNEGWDHIEIYYPKDCDMVDADEHYNLEKDFDQKNHHHTLTVGEHEEKAQMIATARGYGWLVGWAAAFHDCGKVWCQVIKEGDPDAHYYSHENVSAYQFLTMEAAQWAYDMGTKVQVIETAALITWHMVPYQFQHDEVPKNSFMAWASTHKFDKDFAERLWHLHECDVAAH